MGKAVQRRGVETGRRLNPKWGHMEKVVTTWSFLNLLNLLYFCNPVVFCSSEELSGMIVKYGYHRWIWTWIEGQQHLPRMPRGFQTRKCQKGRPFYGGKSGLELPICPEWSYFFCFVFFPPHCYLFSLLPHFARVGSLVTSSCFTPSQRQGPAQKSPVLRCTQLGTPHSAWFLCIWYIPVFTSRVTAWDLGRCACVHMFICAHRHTPLSYTGLQMAEIRYSNLNSR